MSPMLSTLQFLNQKFSFSQFLIMSLLKIITYSYTADVGSLVEKVYVGVRVAVAGYEIGEKFIITERIE